MTDREDLVMQAPHVHEWRLHEWRYAVGSHIWMGPVNNDAPPIACECGAGSGNWAEVMVNLHVEAACAIPVKDIWPDGDYPRPVTAESVKALIEELGGSEKVLREWDLLPGLTIDVFVTQKRGGS